MNPRRLALLLAMLSPIFNLVVLLWIGFHQAHRHHPVTGRLPVRFYFTLTFSVWLVAAVLTAVRVFSARRHGRDGIRRDVRWVILMLVVTGLFFSLMTLMMRG